MTSSTGIVNYEWNAEEGTKMNLSYDTGQTEDFEDFEDFDDFDDDYS